MKIIIRIILGIFGIHVHDWKYVSDTIIYAPPIDAGPFAMGIWETTSACECSATKIYRSKGFI